MLEDLLTLPMFWKAVALCVIVFGVSFWYSFKTGGRDFWDDLNSRHRSEAEGERLDKAGD